MDRQSHLYPGFVHASALPSVVEQRAQQCRVLRRILPRHNANGGFLSVGSGYGDELRVFLSGVKALHDGWLIDAIDMSPDGRHAMTIPEVLALGNRFRFTHMDLMDLAVHPRYGRWEFAQCGFVLEDVPYGQKQDAYDLLYAGLSVTGKLIVSEMFLDNRIRTGSLDDARKSRIAALYSQFLDEAEQCVAAGALGKAELICLRGDGAGSGLLAARNDAMLGTRDFFETRDQTEDHLRRSGFKSLSFAANRINKHLGVLVACKTECEAPNASSAQLL